MRLRNIFSILSSVLFGLTAIGIWIITKHFQNMVVLLLLSALALSGHSIFGNQMPTEGQRMEDIKKEKLKFNIIRFGIFAIAILLFILQVIIDLQ